MPTARKWSRTCDRLRANQASLIRSGGARATLADAASAPSPQESNQCFLPATFCVGLAPTAGSPFFVLEDVYKQITFCRSCQHPMPSANEMVHGRRLGSVSLLLAISFSSKAEMSFLQMPRYRPCSPGSAVPYLQSIIIRLQADCIVHSIRRFIFHDCKTCLNCACLSDSFTLMFFCHECLCCSSLETVSPSRWMKHL